MLKSFPETCHLLSDFVIWWRHSGMLIPGLAFSHCVKVRLSIEMMQRFGGQKLHLQGTKNLRCLIGRPFCWRLSEIVLISWLASQIGHWGSQWVLVAHCATCWSKTQEAEPAASKELRGSARKTKQRGEREAGRGEVTHLKCTTGQVRASRGTGISRFPVRRWHGSHVKAGVNNWGCFAQAVTLCPEIRGTKMASSRGPVLPYLLWKVFWIRSEGLSSSEVSLLIYITHSIIESQNHRII